MIDTLIRALRGTMRSPVRTLLVVVPAAVEAESGRAESQGEEFGTACINEAADVTGGTRRCSI